MIGFIIGVLLCAVLFLSWQLYIKKDTTVSEEEDLVKRERKHFTNLMNYSAEKAYGGK